MIQEKAWDIYTIGHSTHSLERFTELLGTHSVTAVADVRSHPYSRYNPQFNRETLKAHLKAHGIEYVFLGSELGARSEDPACYLEGQVRFELVARSPFFKEGLTRVHKGMKTHRICLMCAEKDPLFCHRTILVCRYLRAPGIQINHILEDGTIERHQDAERRLMEILRVPESTLFTTFEQELERAYDIQGRKIAYVEKKGDEENRQGGLTP
jgi:uncharacterized protein (DUF488 family)